jgi:hypothetical protein
MKDKIFKYSNIVKNTLNKYNFAKKNYYNLISNLKPTIIKSNKEISSIDQIINDNPKKMDIILQNGKVKIYYKVIEHEYFY